MRRNGLCVRKAFTLVEVLVAVGLVGLVATVAVGPLVALVVRLEAVQADYAGESALSAAALAIASDCRQILPQEGKNAFRSIRRDLVGNRRTDVLFFWTGAPLARKQPAATEIYAILEPGPFREIAKPGLYRWTMPGLMPEEVFPERLDPAAGTLVVKNADLFAIRVFDGKEWVEDYSGPLPPGISIQIGRKGENVTHVDTLAAF
jgi:prepilin-type N-terminal cleavage/methylation domain-containing protein